MDWHAFFYDPWTIGIGSALAATAVGGAAAFALRRKRVPPRGPPPLAPTTHAPQSAPGTGNVQLQGTVHGDVHVNVGVPTARPTPATPTAKPPQDFTGRREELDQIERAFANARGVAVQGLMGKGGVGKTTLALAAAHRLRPSFPGGQVVVNLRGSRADPLTPEEAMEEALYALDPTASLKDLTPRQLRGLYHAKLAEKALLLLLDDARDADQVSPLLPPAPCGVIVTSRMRFPLPGMETLALDVLPAEDARRLLQTLCPRLTPREADAVADRCGRLPLALRIAGSTLELDRDLRVDAYLQGLRDGVDRLRKLKVDGASDLDVEACFQLSYDRMPTRLQQHWRILGVFPAPFSWSAAAMVWDVSEEDARESLRVLARRSLLDYDPEADRYALHDLLRDFAGSRLGAAEARDARLRHAQHYLLVAAVAGDLYMEGGENVLHGLQLFDAEWPHLRAAQAWSAEEASRDTEAAKLANRFPNAAGGCLALRLHARDAIRWLEAGLQAARALHERAAEASHRGNLGNAHLRLGDVRKALYHHTEALALSREVGDRGMESTGLGSLGLCHARLGDTASAIEHHSKALAISRELGDEHQELNHLGNLGSAYREQDKIHEAIRHHEQALALCRKTGDRRGEGVSFSNLGVDHRRLGDLEKATEYYMAALAISRELGDRISEAIVLGNLGSVHGMRGDLPQAIQHHEQALAISRETGDSRGEANDLGNLSLTYEAMGDVRRALDFHEQALRIFEAIESPSAGRARAHVARLRAKLQP